MGATTAPEDPRRPDLKSLAVGPTRLGEYVTRIVAGNRGPMTLDGTNTYVVHDSGRAVVIDPGPTAQAHQDAIDDVLRDLGTQLQAALVTHQHDDHAASLGLIANRFARDDSPLLIGMAPEAEDSADEPTIQKLALVDGSRVAVGSLALEVVATPGHTADHVSFLLHSPDATERVLFSGDHLLGRGTTFIAYPDGDLAAYLGSLDRAAGVEATTILPGHGPAIDHNPSAVMDYYRRHRLFRIEQVTAALRQQPRTAVDLVDAIYSSPTGLIRAAAIATTTAVLHYLHDRRVAHPDNTALLGNKALAHRNTAASSTESSLWRITSTAAD